MKGGGLGCIVWGRVGDVHLNWRLDIVGWSGGRESKGCIVWEGRGIGLIVVIQVKVGLEGGGSSRLSELGPVGRCSRSSVRVLGSGFRIDLIDSSSPQELEYLRIIGSRPIRVLDS